MSTDRRSSPNTSIVQPGDLVAGKYRIERVMAVGGMGVILAARHEELDQQVVLKLMRPEAIKSEEAVARFLREARTAARLQSEHVARVYDVGTIDSVPYMVMEYLSGLDLQQVLDARGPFPIEEAVDNVLQTLEAVAEAHSVGIVHRDLKPSNIFLTSRADGTLRVKVLDFGISKENGLDAPAGDALTATKQVIGSPGYMSPEQMLSPKSVDGRTDVWAIGVLLFELLTGQSPFRGETVAAVMTSILHKPAPKLRSKREDAPEGLEEVVELCLKHDASARFANVADLALALQPFASDSGRLSVPRVEHALGTPGVRSSPPEADTVSAARTAEAHILSASMGSPQAGHGGTPRRFVAALGAAALVLGFLVSIGWLRAHPSEALADLDTKSAQAASVVAVGARAVAVALAPSPEEPAGQAAGAAAADKTPPEGLSETPSVKLTEPSAAAATSTSTPATKPDAGAPSAPSNGGKAGTKPRKVKDLLGERQ